MFSATKARPAKIAEVIGMTHSDEATVREIASGAISRVASGG